MKLLVSRIVKKLTERGRTVSFAESCTGGWISKRITDIPGASTVFKGSCIVYWNEAKQTFLGVKSKTIKQSGAVSRQTASEMAEGIRKKMKTTYGLSVTGIAGPGGGTPQKPVGLVFIALSSAKGCEALKFVFKGNRKQVREQATQKALEILDANC
jgi:nicotinamide-nucleotide amidase